MGHGAVSFRECGRLVECDLISGVQDPPTRRLSVSDGKVELMEVLGPVEANAQRLSWSSVVPIVAFTVRVECAYRLEEEA